MNDIGKFRHTREQKMNETGQKWLFKR